MKDDIQQFRGIRARASDFFAANPGINHVTMADVVIERNGGTTVNIILEVTTPRPACVLPAAHPARAHVAASNTDVAATWEPHRPIQHQDDYDLVERDAWLETPGTFK